MKASILLLPGDGIGPEVVAAAERVLRAVADRFHHQFDLRDGAHRRRGAAARAAAAARRDARRGAQRGRASCSARSAIRRSITAHSVAAARSRAPRRSAASSGSTRTCGRRGSGRASRRPGRSSPRVLAGTDLLVVRELTGGLVLRRAARHLGRRQHARTTRCATRATRSSASRGGRSTRRGCGASA